MIKSDKHYQAIGIPYAALVSVIFGLMIVSFPIGAYLVFNSGIGEEINFDYPISGFDFFIGGINYKIPLEIQLGDAFIVIWSIFLILFTISLFGPKRNFLNTLISIMTSGKFQKDTNYLVAIIKWFTILVITSGIINVIQETIGVFIEPPIISNSLIQFYNISIAAIMEEIGFRVMLVGLPLFFLYTSKTSWGSFIKSLWRPSQNLHVYDNKKAYAIIISVGIFFGLAHIISGEPWSVGKFSQATASGIILGWVYFRHGLLPAILIHWAANYFIFSYVFFVADINQIAIESAYTHSLIHTFEILFVVTGVLSLIFVISDFVKRKKEEKLQI